MLIASVCSDYVLARVIVIIKGIITLIQIIVPILLIIVGGIKFGQMVIAPDPDEKQKPKHDTRKHQFINSVFAAVIVFFMPFVINLFMNMISNGFEGENNAIVDVATCWSEAENTFDNMDE